MLERVRVPACVIKQACKSKQEAESEGIIYFQYLLGIEFVAGLKDEVKKELRFNVNREDSKAMLSHKIGCLDALSAWRKLTNQY